MSYTQEINMEPKVMKVWRMMFLFKSVIFRFHVNFHFRGVTFFPHKTTSWWLNQPIYSNWIISPSRGENNKYLKPPPRKVSPKHPQGTQSIDTHWGSVFGDPQTTTKRIFSADVPSEHEMILQKRLAFPTKAAKRCPFFWGLDSPHDSFPPFSTPCWSWSMAFMDGFFSWSLAGWNPHFVKGIYLFLL